MARLTAALAVLCAASACQQSNPLPELARPEEPQAVKVVRKAPEEKPKSEAPRLKGALPSGAEGQLGKKDAAHQGMLKILGSTGTGGSLDSLGSGDAVGIGGLGTRGSGSGAGGLGMRGLAAKGGGGGLGALGGVGYGSGHGLLGVQGRGGGRMMADPVASAESYGEYGINAWVQTQTDRLSTFAVDVDTASYTVGRRKLLEGELPPPESVRVEEWLNYFRYQYRAPEGGPLSVTLNAAPSPFSPGKHLLRVGVQGKRVAIHERKIAHLTFLVDVSGSMASPDKLPLAKRALRMLVDALHDGDTVALVTYAGNVRVVLPPTGMEKKAQIHEAIAALGAGGSTAMASGIELAYAEAAKTLDSHSVSRVIILSDGDANVGRTSHDQILQLIAGKMKEGVTVTTVGFGMGNYKDQLMEQFANKGNGNHYYCDSLFEAKRIFVEQLGGTLEVIAQDVKLQVDFDPAQVKAYRLVGYENRDIADRDFRNDKVDAGEIGAGHSVTALYELELAPGAGDGLVTVRLRAKKPRGVDASEQAFKFQASALASRFDEAPADFRFATAVMGAAEIFRHSPHAKNWSYALVQELARSATPAGNAEREEFLGLLAQAKAVAAPVAAR
ncbi:MAG: Von Willebrand factor type domain protein [Myxococcaceae bacterium]|nr:Von Willebrand factor type domain protein [Myxococcaceae bacterium]